MTSLRTGFLFAAIAFIFSSAVMNIQAHGWLAWYRLSVLGQQTQANVIHLQPDFHNSCVFEYRVNFLKYEGKEGGCDAAMGQSVTVTYLPSEPLFVTLKSPKKELGLQVFAAMFMSIIAGFVGVLRVR